MSFEALSPARRPRRAQTDFINEVNAQTDKTIPADTAGQLTTAAGQVQTLLSCGS
jgi:hypothetical protein